MAMNCSCRTAALRIFVRSVAEFQLPAGGRAQALRPTQGCSPHAQHRAATALRRPFAPYTPSGASYRSFATSSTRKREDSDDTVFKPEECSIRKEEESGDRIFDLEESSIRRREDSHDTTFDATFDKLGERPSQAQSRSSRSPRTKSRTEVRRPRAETRKPWTETRKDDAPADQGEQPEKPTRETWQIQKAALKAKFPEGWNPRKRLSPDALAGIRALHQQFPDAYSTETLAQKFEVSPEAIRRILKSKWEPSPEEEVSRQDRWYNRGKSVWERWAALGKKPPQRWRKDGVVRDPSWNEKGGRRSLASAQKKLARNLL